MAHLTRITNNPLLSGRSGRSLTSSNAHNLPRVRSHSSVLTAFRYSRASRRFSASTWVLYCTIFHVGESSLLSPPTAEATTTGDGAACAFGGGVSMRPPPLPTPPNVASRTLTELRRPSVKSLRFGFATPSCSRRRRCESVVRERFRPRFGLSAMTRPSDQRA